MAECRDVRTAASSVKVAQHQQQDVCCGRTNGLGPCNGTRGWGEGRQCQRQTPNEVVERRRRSVP